MKKYKFELVIEEGSDEFWEGIDGNNGCNDVETLVESALEMYGFHEGDNCKLTLIEYTNT
ncbi:hypothetical protein [Oceanisphaera arctica]|uniref:Uncharacterized protein n=1 Tax=Oceanisphaera arctica TaxID=641510 RepID=A0A2P5TQM8_9GAMM|nr:hypothetical protein [Oceanisphaera arctica]PPL18066.1 hypothetical protein UN63_02585 [Oceanisphaera arctica]GHA09572.1 hypothetical protein GCM10007082_08130 [Oceanisphaera arctica]